MSDIVSLQRAHIFDVVMMFMPKPRLGRSITYRSVYHEKKHHLSPQDFIRQPRGYLVVNLLDLAGHFHDILKSGTSQIGNTISRVLA